MNMPASNDGAPGRAIDAIVTPLLFPTLHVRPPTAARCLVMAHDPAHPRCEEIRTLRTELLLRHDEAKGANIIALLSPCHAEGRSQLAAELAISFAQLGSTTLLVDADLRHGHQHVLFNADTRSGLSQALQDREPAEPQSISGIPGLRLLTAGTASTNPLELLSNRRFAGLVDEWRERFDFVVLDTPPVRHYADALAVAAVVGRVLSLSRAGATSYKDSRDMLRRLAATQSQILGGVINYF